MSSPSPPPYTESADPAAIHIHIPHPASPLSPPAVRFSPPIGPYTVQSPQNVQHHDHHPHHQHLIFGPTPLSTQPLVQYAYYDPRSPYSITQADARARRRFVLAMFWALVIWCLIGTFVGTELAVAYSNKHGQEGHRPGQSPGWTATDGWW